MRGGETTATKSVSERKVVEEFFGWSKSVAGLRREKHVGR